MPSYIPLPSFSELLASSLPSNDLDARPGPLNAPSPTLHHAHNFVPLTLPPERYNYDHRANNGAQRSLVYEHSAPEAPQLLSAPTSLPTISIPTPSLPAVPFETHYCTGTPCSDSRYQFVRCPRCQAELKVLISKPEFHWRQHLAGPKCERARKRLEARTVRNDAAQMHRELFSGGADAARRTQLDVRAVSNPLPSRSSSCQPQPVSRAATEARSLSLHDNLPCCGAVLPWTAGPVYQTLDLHSLALASGFRLGSVVEDAVTYESVLRVRSHACRLRFRADVDAEACSECLALLVSSKVAQFVERAAAPWKPYMRYEDMTRTQLVDAIRHKNGVLTKTRVERNRAQKRAETAAEKVKLHERLVAALATQDVPRLQRLLQVAMDQGRSIEDILKRIEDAVTAVYHVKSFSATEIDLARVMWHLAGDKGAYILHKALGFPSVTTIREQSQSTRPTIHPSPSTPTLEYITRNLLSMFPSNPTRRVCRCGQAIMFDGIAIRKCMRRDDDHMVGACRECTAGMDLSMSCLENILSLARAVRRGDNGEDPLVHFGVEATVGAMGALRGIDYHAYPFSVSASCKAEKASEFKDYLELHLLAWKMVCAETYGDIWIVGCDGASVFRGACFQLLMASTFSDDLRAMLSPLRGLNLQCGPDDVVHCPDPKHLIKRFSSLLRSPTGTLIKGVVINRSVLSRFLQKLPDETPQSVDKLLNPDDGQNVPDAVDLLQSIISLRDLDPRTFTDPTDHITFKALLLLGELWDAFLGTYLRPADSLSEQLASLSKYAHLAYVLYTKHGSAFMPPPLYSDTMALVKASFTSVARQKQLNPLERVYLFLLGSDRLEQLFSEVRTQSHDSNCDIKQLSSRLSIAADIRSILNQYPDWDRGHRRRSFLRNGGVDHVNPRRYTGDLIAGHVDLEWSWDTGRGRAETSLGGAGYPNVDILELLSLSPGSDFMKPDGHTYPGASTEHDRSLSDENSTAQASTNAPGTAEEEPIVTDESPGTAEDEAPRLRDEIELREALQVAIARLEATEMVGDRPPATRDVVDWILVPREDGSDPIPVFKETILRLWFNDGVDSSLSFDRPRRVRGLSKFGYLLAAVPSDNPTVTRLAHELLHDPHLPPTDSTASTSALHLLPPADTSSTLFPQDIAIVPIRTPDAISLALIKITDIEALGKRVKQVTLQELGRREDKVFVSGQVLVLAREANATAGEGHYFWLWTGEYVQFSHASGKPSKAEDGTRSAYVVRTPGHLVTPVAELMRPSALLAPGSRATLDQLGMPLTYAASDVCLDLLLRQIYSSAQVTAASLLSALPKHGTAKGFPYLGNQGDVRFAMSGIKDAIAQKQGDENEKMSCHQCGTLVKRKELRGHVGTHILRALVGQMEPDLLEQIDLIAHPCGVCGRSGCTVELDGVNAGSSCERFWPFTTGRANKSTNPNPSSNVPIECGLCKPIHPRSKQRPVFWKYNVFLHIRIAHPDQWDTRTRRPFNIHPDFACDMDLKPGELDAVAPSRALPYPQPDPCAPPSPQHSDSRGSRRDAPVHSSSSSHDPAAKHTKLTLY